MIYYLNPNKNPSGAYSAPQTTKAYGLIAIMDEQKQTVLKYNGFVTLSEGENGETVITPNIEAWEQWKATQPNKLEELKEQKIAQSKTDLETYLAEHPLQYTNGKYYTITEEKQRQLTSKLVSASFAQQAGVPYNLTWNDTTQVCEPWTVENLTALAFAIDARVTALVTYQQKKEVEIRNAETLEELESIKVDYDEVI